MRYLITQDRDGIKVPIFYTSEKFTRDVILKKIPNTEYSNIPEFFTPPKEDIELLRIPKFMKSYRVANYGGPYEISWERFDIDRYYGNRYLSGDGCEISNTVLYNCILDCTDGGHGALQYNFFTLARNKEEAKNKYDIMLKEHKYVYILGQIYLLKNIVNM